MSELKRSLAVVVGINQYINGIPALKTAVNDAQELAQILEEKYQYRVLLLKDANYETLRNLFAAFEEQVFPLAEGLIKIEPDERVLFYFAGHGIAIDGLDNVDGPVGFLVPQDARLEDESTLLPMQQLHDALLKLPCRHLLIILDCCFAGTFRWAGLHREAVRKQKVYRERYDRFISGCAQQVITSAAHDEKAADSLYRLGQRGNIDGHSPFAELLLKGLEGEADFTKDGIITATELYLYLHSELGKLLARQTPGFCQLRRHDKGEYIFPIPGFEPQKLPPAPRLDENTNPYRGLQSFEEEHSKLFFGRTGLIEKLSQFVFDHPLTVVLAASGSGKSSLMKAGLIPQLRQRQWRILPPIRPGESPFLALNKMLERENLPVVELQTPEGRIKDLLARVANWSQHNPNSKLLLAIDQFEELVTLCPNDFEREQFLSGLAQAIALYPERLRIVLTLRSDFEPQFRDTALEQYWATARFVVTGMTRQELGEVIKEPAIARVMFFEPPNLIDQLIDEVAQMPGALPLLSFALSELYLKYIKSVREGKRNNRAITQEDYEEIGGVTRSLTQRADCEYDNLVKLDPVYAQVIRDVMLRMVAVGGGELARRQVLCSELEYPEPKNKYVKQVIERFSSARLLVEGQNAEGDRYVEPAHDALVRGWQRLLVWKQQEQETLALQRRLTPAALEWKSSQQTRFLWHANPRLGLLKQVLKFNDNWFNKVEAEFVQRSVRQRQKNIIRLWSLVTIVFIVLSSATIIAINSARDALNQSLETHIASSEAYLSSYRHLEALVEGVKAGELLNKNTFFFGEDSRIRVAATLQHLIYQVRERNSLEKHTDSVTSVNFSPDGKIIASASKDNTIKLWQWDGQLLQTLPEPQNGLFSVSFCRSNGQILISASYYFIRLWQRQPDGTFKWTQFFSDKDGIEAVSLSRDCQTIATGSSKNTVKLWRMDGKPLKTFSQKHSDQVRGLDFSPDDQTIASASRDGTIKLWSRKDGKLLKTIDGKRVAFYAVRFVDSTTIASASEDRTVKLWDLNSKPFIKQTFEGHSDKVLYLDVSRDGKTIASTSQDSTVKLWSRKDGNVLQNIKSFSGIVNQVSFSRDSKIIALAGEDKTVRLWSVDGMVSPPKNLQGSNLSFSPDGQMIVLGDRDGNVRLWQRDDKLLWTVHAHCDRVQHVRFSPNGQEIASASLDGTVKLWNLKRELVRTLQGHKGKVMDVSFSPNGKTIASSGADMIVKLWYLDDGALLKNFKGHTGVVTSVSFSPDGKTIASASDDKTVRLWHLDGRLPKTLKGHDKGVLGVSFSPNGEMIASASSDHTVRLWDITGRLLKRLEHSDSVFTAKFSRSGQIVASASSDKTIKLWSKDGRLLQTLQGHNRPIYDISFSSTEAQTIASADFDQKVLLWNLDLDNLLSQSCSWLHNYLKSNNNNSDLDLCH